MELLRRKCPACHSSEIHYHSSSSPNCCAKATWRAARTLEKAKNTILAWESKFVDLHRVLFLYAVVHEFLASVIEGDEA